MVENGFQNKCVEQHVKAASDDEAVIPFNLRLQRTERGDFYPDSRSWAHIRQSFRREAGYGQVSYYDAKSR